MKATYKFIYLSLIFTVTIFSPKQALTQTLPTMIKVRGIVADSLTGKPLDFVTVSLKDPNGQTVKTTLTKTDGSFSFDGMSSTAGYSVHIISVGYVSRTIKLNNNTDQSLGTVFITPQNYNLSEVTVVADRTIVRQEADRISYDLKADSESKSSTALEIMRKVPLLSVDSEDNVLMNGNRSYKILVNGKPSGMMERNAKDILRSMPASSIKNIEVIFSPSSKYDAEGVAGIINIITDKKIDNGYNGTLSLTERFPLGGPSTGGTFTLKQGKLGASVLAGIGQYLSPVANTDIIRHTSLSNAMLSQRIDKKSDSKNGYAGAELSYELDSLHLISGQFNMSENRLTGSSGQVSVLADQISILQGYHLNNNINGRGNSADGGLNYQMGFKSGKARLLTFSYRYLHYENNQQNALNSSNLVNFVLPNYNQNNVGRSAEQTAQIDYVHPLAKVSIESGIKAIFRNNSSDFSHRTADPITGIYHIDATRSNQFNSRQNVYSLYNTYQFKLGDWSFKAGARVEQTTIEADFVSTATRVRQNYLNFIPSVAINKKFKDMGSLSLSYVSRMQRPGITQLNPFIDRSNPDFEMTGNPDLKPTITNVVQLSYNRSKKTTISVTAAYMFFNSLIENVSSYNPVNQITNIRYENVSDGRILRSNIYINYPASNRLNLTFNTDIRYLWLNTMVNNQEISNNGLMAYLNLSAGYRFEKSWRLNANFTANSSNVSGPQSTLNGYTATSFSVNKEIVKDKLTFSAMVTNPLSKYRQNIEERSGPEFNQLTTSQNYYRGFGVGLNYRFGKLKGQIAKSKKAIVNDDEMAK